MKKSVVAITMALFVCFELCGQEMIAPAPKFQMGVVFFRVSDSFAVEHIPVLEDYSVEESYFPQLKPIFEKYGLTKLSRPFAVFSHSALLRIFEMRFAEIYEIDQLVRDLEEVDFINYVEKDPEQTPFWTPNDPFYGTLDGKNMRWHLDMIQAEEAWNIQQGDPNIKVAIVDNFVWGEHPDLDIAPANQYNTTNGSVGNASPAGLVSQYPSETSYLYSHGTHSAGLVGAKNNNGVGVASIGGGVTLLGIRTANQYGNMYNSANGVAWAVSQGARVVSMSYGSLYYSQLEDEVFQSYCDAGVILVAAAGNEGNQGNPKTYPACYPSVISVASVNADATLSYFSQYGAANADIAAPGGFIASPTVSPNILSTTYCTPYFFDNNTVLADSFYDGMQGTSMSCPMVSGLCGLLLSAKPHLTPAQVKQSLQKSARPLSPSSSTNIGGNGYIDALGALLVLDTNCFYATPQHVNNTVLQSNDTISIYSQQGWAIQQNYPDWIISIDTQRLNTILVQMVVKVAENTTIFPRTTTLSLYSDDLGSTIVLTIHQDAALPMLEVNKEMIRISQEQGSTSELSIKSNIDWTISGIVPAWLSLSDMSGIGDKKIVFTATTSNFTSAPLSSTFTLSGTSVSNILLTVYQMDEELFLTVDKSSILLASSRNARDTIFISSNTDWQISISDANFASFTPKVGFGDQQVIVTALMDNTMPLIVQRMATIECNGCENVDVDIVQRAAPFCNLPITNFTLGSTVGDTVGIDVHSNMEWTILANASSWVTVNATNGRDSARIICTATADNATGSSRVTTFQVKTASSLKSFRITQPSQATGIADFVVEAISISPNPTNGQLTLENGKLPIETIEIFDVVGRRLTNFQFSTVNSQLNIDISHLENGMYFVKINNTVLKVTKN